jgi:hypothetical protein
MQNANLKRSLIKQKIINLRIVFEGHVMFIIKANCMFKAKNMLKNI